MRDQWYGDHRDVVKWGVLLEIARKLGCEHVLQVLYSRPSTWSHLEIDGQQVPLSVEVIRHFRCTSAISAMSSEITIEIIQDEFRNRIEYQQTVIQRINNGTKAKSIVFLDPDTGLEPTGKAGLQHVLESELTEIWASLRTGDVLVLYQHKTNYNNEPWIPTKMCQFETALGVTRGMAKLAHAPGIANDVAFFFAEKN